MSYVHYHNIQSSLLRFCQEFADTQGIAAINLDAHTDDSSWPEGDFIGLSELRVDIRETYAGACMFGISTKDDTNLYRMGKMVKDFSGLVLPNKNIPVFDSETGDVAGMIFVLQGTRIGAPVPTKLHSIIPVGVRFESDLKSF